MLGSDLAAALDAVAFARLLGIEPDGWQRDVLRSTAKRQLLNVHRQGGKSQTAAILALHTALYRPASLTICVSPSLRQSLEIFKKITDLLARLPQPPEMTEDTKTSATLANGSRVISLPSSEATIRGYSAVTLAIFDEAARVEDALFHAVSPMLAVSDGALIAMSTPWGRSGWWAQAWHDSDDWQKVAVPASACRRISREFLARERATMGDWWYQQEYENVFNADESSVFDPADIRRALNPAVSLLFPQGVA